MAVKFRIELDEKAFLALRNLADDEYREARTQAAIIIRTELQRRGLLVVEEPKPYPQKHLVSSGGAKGRGA